MAIHIKKSKRGSLHKALGIKKGEKIPASKLKDKPGDSPAMKKKKVFARNARKWNKGEFGISLQDPDPIPFKLNGYTPHDPLPSIPRLAPIGEAPDPSKALTDYMKSTDRLKKIKQPRQFGNPDLSSQIAMGLSLIDSVIPTDRIDYFHPVRNQQTYNPHPYGTGSQAIYKKGGTLSAGKAKEMLRDGTAHGKKLTKKQKRYFGMVAAGKAASGLNLGGGVDEGGLLLPTGTQNDSAISDMLHKMIAAGGNPMQTNDGKTFLKTALPILGEQATHDLINSVVIHNTNPATFNLSPEQRITSYYDTPSSNQAVTNIKNRFRTIGYGPVASYTDSPDVDSYSSKVARMSQGGQLNTSDIMSQWGGDIEKISFNPYDGGTVEFKGNSHEDGGIGIKYGNKKAEVEGGESGISTPDGSLHIMGNMNIPNTKVKFKTVGKKIAEKEREYDKVKTLGAELVNQANPHNKYERLTFNAGKVMMEGGDMGQRDLVKKKMDLASLQNAMLDTAEEFNLDPEAMSSGKNKKAKKGMYLKAPGGAILRSTSGGGPGPKKDSVAVRHNNPGNIKYGEFAKRYGAIPGENATDGGRFAKFPDINTGMKALKGLLKTDNYRNLPVDKAIKRWTGGSGYALDLSKFGGKTISQLNDGEFNNLVNTITMGEDNKYYTDPQPSTPTGTPTITTKGQPPITLTDRPLTYKPPTPVQVNNPNPPELTHITPPTDRDIPSNVEGLDVMQVLPELFALGQNQEEPVPVQKYMPDLLEPYQVTYQERRNENQSTFNAISRLMENNPAALSSIAAQKYSADNAVGAEEFRTNQAISNDITNKNISLLNDAQLKNLSLADQQYIRQSQGRSNTKEQNQEILNSIGSKYLQNKQENQKLALYENLYNYRFGDTNNDGINDKAVNYNPDASFEWGVPTPTTTPSYDRVRTTKDAAGTIKQIQTTTPSSKEREKLDLNIQKMKDDLDLFSIQQLFKKGPTRR